MLSPAVVTVALLLWTASALQSSRS
eukprot:COSAG03_NODE_17538_length_373_cov_1.054745_1_plen_24_part_01